MLKHSDVWLAIDRLAARNGLSPSGLAKKAGLSPTLFNVSKRISSKRRRWPSTESVAAVLRATSTSFAEFVKLAEEEPPPASPKCLPSLTLSEAAKPNAFGEDDLPTADFWGEMEMPFAATACDAFCLIMDDDAHAPVYRKGEVLVVFPSQKPQRGDRVMARTTNGEIIIGSLAREGGRGTAGAEISPAAQISRALSGKDLRRIYLIGWIKGQD